MKWWNLAIYRYMLLLWSQLHPVVTVFQRLVFAHNLEPSWVYGTTATYFNVRWKSEWMTMENSQSFFSERVTRRLQPNHIVIFVNALFKKSLWFMDAIFIPIWVKAQTVWIVGWTYCEKYCETWHLVELCSILWCLPTTLWNWSRPPVMYVIGSLTV